MHFIIDGQPVLRQQIELQFWSIHAWEYPVDAYGRTNRNPMEGIDPSFL
jgi:hypothetical protein